MNKSNVVSMVDFKNRVEEQREEQRKAGREKFHADNRLRNERMDLERQIKYHMDQVEVYKQVGKEAAVPADAFVARLFAKEELLAARVLIKKLNAL